MIFSIETTLSDKVRRGDKNQNLFGRDESVNTERGGLELKEIIGFRDFRISKTRSVDNARDRLLSQNQMHWCWILSLALE